MAARTIDPAETVSRFLIKGDIRTSDNTVKYGAFLPSASNLEISTFRIYGLSNEEIWAIAVANVEPMRGPVIGRGDLTVSTIIEESLQVRPDQDPVSRHADIVGWPDDRNARATIAKVLAQKASPPNKR